MSAEWTGKIRTLPHDDPLAAEARQLAIRARLTSAYETDASFRYSVNQVLAQTQHIADQAIDELIVELNKRDTKKEEPPPPAASKADNQWSLQTWFYIALATMLVLGGIFVGIVEFLAWWRMAFEKCHL